MRQLLVPNVYSIDFGKSPNVSGEKVLVGMRKSYVWFSWTLQIPIRKSSSLIEFEL